MTGEERRDGWSHGRPAEGARGPSGWDEVPSRDPNYDPSAPPPDPYWDPGAAGPRGDPYGDRYAEPRYSFQPPPPAYAQYPPPVYANPYGYPAYYRRPPNPGLAIAGGVMSLVAGSMGVIWTLLLMGDGGAFWMFGFGWCVVIGLVMSAVAIIGGVMAMMRRMFPLALIGAICSMLTFGFFGVSFLIGLIAVILIAISKDAFIDSTSMPVSFRY